MKKPIPFHPLLFALHPVLFLYAQNIDILRVGQIFPATILIFSATVSAWLILSVCLRDISRSALIVSISLLAFFSYGHFINPHTGVLFGTITIAKQRYPLMLLVFCVGSCSYLIIRARNRVVTITKLFNVAGLLLVIFPMSILLSTTLTEQTPAARLQLVSPVPRSSATHATTERPNIFYVILDAYGRADVLRAFYGLQTQDFLSQLNKRDFYIADLSFANYCQTSLSLASSLNLTYLDAIARKMGKESANKKPLISMIQSSYATKFLKAQGYRFVFFDSGSMWTNTRNADIYMTPSTSLSEFENQLLDFTPLPVLFSKLGQLGLWELGRVQYEIHRRLILYPFANLPKVAKYPFPVFVIAHILAPHVPFIFGENGERVNLDKSPTQDEPTWLKDRAGYRKGYARQIRFVNRKVLELVDRLIANSSIPPIILIQGDHGPSLNSSDTRGKRHPGAFWLEKMAILNAYHLPGTAKKKLYRSISPVNSFRVIFNGYFGTSFPLLDDRSYGSKWHKPYDFHDVTNIVRSMQDAIPFQK